MNKEQVEGKFAQMKGEIKKIWGKLTDDEIMLYDGQQEKFYGTLKVKYGIAREEAEKQLSALEKSHVLAIAKKEDANKAA